MDGEAVPDLIYDQSLGLYYPAVTDYYGYYYTGAEPPLSEWDSHHQFFGQDQHISAVQAESLPNVYYIPSYGYVQSPYNPYNPSIPGAVMGTEASFIETHYPPNPSHQLVVSSPAYIPVGIDSSSETVPNSYLNPLLTSAGALPATKPDGEIKKLASPIVPQFAPRNRSQGSLGVGSEYLASNTLQPSSSHSHTIPIQKEVLVANAAPANKPSVGSYINGGIHGVNQGSHQLSNMKVPSVYRPAKVTLPPSNGYTNYASDINHWATGNTGDRLRPRFQVGGPWIHRNGNLPEQSRGPRTGLAKTQWVSPLRVKAYTAKAGAIDPEGNIIISADQFNRDDFAIDFEFAKFFVIKSYSEDDVHKSIKYSVWSSTPSGNKRLDNAFEEAQKLSLGRSQKCPIFLFFSVNASGHFCGVAEMTGAVDFQKDMDFWQQDKWLGSFPVKWHIVKDLSNTSLRHILLENNEYKPVTCSRDTQEIPFLQGMAMLRIFKAASSGTSVLDDFLIYEDRQRILVEEKSRISGRRPNPQFFPPLPVPSNNPDSSAADEDDDDKETTPATSAADDEPAEKEAGSAAEERTQLAGSDERETPPEENGSSTENNEDPKPSNLVLSPTKPMNLVFDDGVNSIMKIGSLLIDSEAGEDPSSSISQSDVITVGSMHIKVGKQASPR
uniref:YTH domain-containing family protein n=1 Tax=Cymbidium ensifolium TaxID=78740 RepID=A0A5J6N9C3_CYMEN|nr:YTH domain-containing family protein 2-like isoform X5 [Cymbidium ensifolium]